MVPIVAIPLVIKEYCGHFAAAFSRREQREAFAAMITGMCTSSNRTLAGIEQRFVFDETNYDRLHHFMSDSPWSIEVLSKLRVQYIKNTLPSVTKKSLFSKRWNAIQNCKSTLPQLAESEKLLPAILACDDRNWNLIKATSVPTVVTIDATFTHHTGEQIYGVYWYWDYAKRRYTLSQRLVLSTIVTPDKQVPLGWKLYHRGFLPEQKIYLEAMLPDTEASQEEWDEYNTLVREYRINSSEHKKQHELAAELVDDVEQSGVKKDAYVCDAALAIPSLLDKIDEYQQAYVTRIAKTRNVQGMTGKFESIEKFAKSLPSESFKSITVYTRHGQLRTYWCFSKTMMIKGWKRQRIVISYDNEKLEGEPIYLITNKKQWVQPEKTVQLYLMRDPIEHLIRDAKQEVGLEDCQQRNEASVQKHWEISFAAYTFLELGFQVPTLPGVPAARLETIGQRSRIMEGAVLQGFVNEVARWVLDGRDTKELIWQYMTKRLNRLAT